MMHYAILDHYYSVRHTTQGAIHVHRYLVSRGFSIFLAR